MIYLRITYLVVCLFFFDILNCLSCVATGKICERKTMKSPTRFILREKHWKNPLKKMKKGLQNQILGSGVDYV